MTPRPLPGRGQSTTEFVLIVALVGAAFLVVPDTLLPALADWHARFTHALSRP